MSQEPRKTKIILRYQDGRETVMDGYISEGGGLSLGNTPPPKKPVSTIEYSIPLSIKAFNKSVFQSLFVPKTKTVPNLMNVAMHLIKGMPLPETWDVRSYQNADGSWNERIEGILTKVAANRAAKAEAEKPKTHTYTFSVSTEVDQYNTRFTAKALRDMLLNSPYVKEAQRLNRHNSPYHFAHNDRIFMHPETLRSLEHAVDSGISNEARRMQDAQWHSAILGDMIKTSQFMPKGTVIMPKCHCLICRSRRHENKPRGISAEDIQRASEAAMKGIREALGITGNIPARSNKMGEIKITGADGWSNAAQDKPAESTYQGTGTFGSGFVGRRDMLKNQLTSRLKRSKANLETLNRNSVDYDDCVQYIRALEGCLASMEPCKSVSTDNTKMLPADRFRHELHLQLEQARQQLAALEQGSVEYYAQLGLIYDIEKCVEAVTSTPVAPPVVPEKSAVGILATMDDVWACYLDNINIYQKEVDAVYDEHADDTGFELSECLGYFQLKTLVEKIQAEIKQIALRSHDHTWTQQPLFRLVDRYLNAAKMFLGDNSNEELDRIAQEIQKASYELLYHIPAIQEGLDLAAAHHAAETQSTAVHAVFESKIQELEKEYREIEDGKDAFGTFLDSFKGFLLELVATPGKTVDIESFSDALKQLDRCVAKYQYQVLGHARMREQAQKTVQGYQDAANVLVFHLIRAFNIDRVAMREKPTADPLTKAVHQIEEYTHKLNRQRSIKKIISDLREQQAQIGSATPAHS